jgi:hypothetical protein
MFTVFLAPKIANLCWWAKSRNDFGRSLVESQLKQPINHRCPIDLGTPADPPLTDYSQAPVGVYSGHSP